MVIEKNVRLMTKIAIYEKNKGRTEIPMTEYYKGDYVRMKTLKSIVAGSVAFALIVALVVLYKAEYLLANIMKMDYEALGIRILVIYGVWVLFYWIVARIIYARRYDKARPNIIIYNHDLKKLQEEMQKQTVKSAKTKGGVVIHDDFADF